MIDKEVARGLLPLVNVPGSHEALLEYVEYRLEQNHRAMEGTNDFNELLRVQGAIRELRRFLTLRDEVIQDAE